MIGSFTTVIRRIALLLIAALGTLAVVGSAHGDTGHGVPPQSAIDAASATWAAKAQLLDANGRPVSSAVVTPASGGNGFDWGDFGIGAAAMLGLVLLGGFAVAVHYGRRAGVRPRTVS